MNTVTPATVEQLKPLNLYLRRIVVLGTFFLITYIAYALVVKSPELVLRLGSDGKILILAALLMVDMATELRVAEKRYTNGLILGALTLLLVFIGVNYLLVPENATETISRLRWALGFFNYSLAICLALVGLYLYSLVAHDVALKKLQGLSQSQVANEAR